MLFQCENGRHKSHVRIRSRATNTFLFFLGIKHPLTWVVSTAELVAAVRVAMNIDTRIIAMGIRYHCTVALMPCVYSYEAFLLVDVHPVWAFASLRVETCLSLIR